MAAQEKIENKVLSTEQVVELTISRLREIQRLQPGSRMPEWMNVDNWGGDLSQLAGDAADLIELYRSGRVPTRSITDFFASLTPDQKRIYLSFWAKP